MCLLVIGVDAHPELPLVVAANRDEYFDRETEAAGFWKDAPHVLAGRDLKGGGTWLGVTRTGRFAALTNYRDPASRRPSAPSRGKLVSDFLTGNQSAESYLAALRARAAEYNGFNFVVGSLPSLRCYSNVNGEKTVLDPGIHGLSNHLLDTTWPKVRRGVEGVREALADFRLPTCPTKLWRSGISDLRFAGRQTRPQQEGGGMGLLLGHADRLVETIFHVLEDSESAPDEELPNTGVPFEVEKRLSPILVNMGRYGTRCSTVVLVDRQGNVRFVERTRDPTGAVASTVGHAFTIESTGEND